MKKILLLIVGGLFIACMAGTAMAAEVGFYGVPSIDINPGSFNHTSFQVSGMDTGYYKLKLEVSGGDIEAYTVDSSGNEVTMGSASNTAKYLSPKESSTFLGESQTGELYIKGSDTGRVKIYLYNSAGTLVDWEEIAYGSVRTNPIPEFPTIALPVAAILGLVFIFGRRKEGL